MSQYKKQRNYKLIEDHDSDESKDSIIKLDKQRRYKKFGTGTFDHDNKKVKDEGSFSRLKLPGKIGDNSISKNIDSSSRFKLMKNHSRNMRKDAEEIIHTQ